MSYIPKNSYIPQDFKHDGCTMPKWLGKLLGAERYVEHCDEHDFLTRYSVTGTIRANLILAYRIRQTHAAGIFRQIAYFLATTAYIPWYPEKNYYRS